MNSANAAAVRRQNMSMHLLLGAAASAMICAMPAQAQDANAPAIEGEDIKEIVVTGGRLGEINMMETPMAIQDIPTEQMRDLHITSVKDLSIVAPTFKVSRSYQGTPQYSVRGIGFNAINMSASPTVTLYQDDVAYPYPITQIGPMFDLGGAQILKGPQGTVFGRNTTAGVINLASNQPTDSFQGSIATEVGNYETFNLEGFVSGPITSWLKGRLAFRTEDSFKGWQVSKSRPDERLGEVHNRGVRLILAADPAPGLDINLTVSGWKNDSDSRAGQSIGLTPGVDKKYAKGTTPDGTNADLEAYLGLQKFNQKTFDFFKRTYPNLTDAEIMEQYASNIFEFDKKSDRLPLHWENGRWADWGSTSATSGLLDGGTLGRANDVGSGMGMSGKLKEDSDFWSFGLDIGYDISDNFRLKSISAFQKLNRGALQDASGAPFEILVQDVSGSIESWSQELRLEGDTGPVKWAIGGYYGKDKIEENIRSLIYNNSNSEAVRANFSSLVGFGGIFLPSIYSDYFKNQGTGLQIGPFEGRFPVGMFRTLRDTATQDVTTKSLLANADWSITDRLNLAVGARYTRDKLNFRGCTRDVGGNTIMGVNSSVAYLIYQGFGPDFIPKNLAAPGECITMSPTGIDKDGKILAPFIRDEVHNVLKEDNFSWRGALNWRPIDELMFYASASRGYKSGVNPLNTANAAQQDAPVKQEELTAYESGLRLDMPGFKLGFGGFYYDYRNKQLSGYFKDPAFTTLARLINIPKSRAMGLEADASIEPVRGFTLFGNALLLDTKITDSKGKGDDPINQLGRASTYDGSSFGNPDWSLSGGASLDTKLTDALGLRATANYTWQSAAKGMRSTQFAYTEKDVFVCDATFCGITDIEHAAQPSPYEDFYDRPAYGTLNASITLFDGDDNDWEFSVWGRNITQTYYAVATASNATTIFRIAGDPRTFGATFRWNFGN